MGRIPSQRAWAALYQPFNTTAMSSTPIVTSVATLARTCCPQLQQQELSSGPPLTTYADWATAVTTGCKCPCASCNHMLDRLSHISHNQGRCVYCDQHENQSSAWKHPILDSAPSYCKSNFGAWGADPYAKYTWRNWIMSSNLWWRRFLHFMLCSKETGCSDQACFLHGGTCFSRYGKHEIW